MQETLIATLGMLGAAFLALASYFVREVFKERSQGHNPGIDNSLIAIRKEIHDSFESLHTELGELRKAIMGHLRDHANR